MTKKQSEINKWISHGHGAKLNLQVVFHGKGPKKINKCK